MRSGALGLLAVLVIGLGVVLWRGLEGREVDAVRPGVAAAGPVADLKPHEELCERPIDLDRSAPRLGLAMLNGAQPGPPVRVRIADADTHELLRTATIPKGWALAPGQYYGLELPHPLPGGRAIEVCARNDGKRAFELWGKEASSSANLYRGEENTGAADWAIFFPLQPRERRTLVQMIPTFLRRASVLRPGIVTPAVYAVLGLLLLVGAPLLLWRAVKRADEDPDPPHPDPPAPA